jgi:hypothetical protein
MWQDDGGQPKNMRKSTQLELPLPKASAADRRARIRDRLAGYEMRQRAREARRREAARRRKLRETEACAVGGQVPVQLEIPPAGSP